MPYDRTLEALFLETIGVVPAPAVFDPVRRFMPSANFELLKHSLKELKAYADRGQVEDLPARLHKVYHRKLAEQASLYPVFHLVESSYRTRLAFWMEAHYRTARWWAPT